MQLSPSPVALYPSGSDILCTLMRRRQWMFVKYSEKVIFQPVIIKLPYSEWRSCAQLERRCWVSRSLGQQVHIRYPCSISVFHATSLCSLVSPDSSCFPNLHLWHISPPLLLLQHTSTFLHFRGSLFPHYLAILFQLLKEVLYHNFCFSSVMKHNTVTNFKGNENEISFRPQSSSAMPGMFIFRVEINPEDEGDAFLLHVSFTCKTTRRQNPWK